MKITLLRHAEVIEAYQGRYNGHIDIPLSSNGKVQAKRLAEALRDENFDSIYCSDLLRARETLNAFNLTLKPTFTDRLREKSWGSHEGKSFEEITAQGLEYHNFEQWLEELDGESISSYRLRVQEYFYRVILEDRSENILILTHSGFIKTLISIINNSSLEEAFSINLPYSSYVTLDRTNMGFSPIKTLHRHSSDIIT